MNVLVDCDGDHGRPPAAARECQAEAARRAPDSPHRAREWARAADLCAMAAAMREGAGGHRDDQIRRRVIASCRQGADGLGR